MKLFLDKLLDTVGTSTQRQQSRCLLCTASLRLRRSQLQYHRPFISAPGYRNESPLLKTALLQVTRIAKQVRLDLNQTVVSLDRVYDNRANRKAIFNRGMIPSIPANPRGRKIPTRGRKAIFDALVVYLVGIHVLVLQFTANFGDENL